MTVYTTSMKIQDYKVAKITIKTKDWIVYIVAESKVWEINIFGKCQKYEKKEIYLGNVRSVRNKYLGNVKSVRNKHTWEMSKMCDK